MSLDRRLHEGFERSAEAIRVEPREELAGVVRRGRRRRSIRRTGVAFGVVTVIVTAVFAAPLVTDLVRDIHNPQPAHPGPTRTIGAGPYRVIAGTYTTTFSAASDIARTNGMAGQWTLRLEGSGVMLLSTPANFNLGTSGLAFQLQGDTFRTNAFVNDACQEAKAVGVYRWARLGGTLTFTPISEPCALRRILFSSGSWQDHS